MAVFVGKMLFFEEAGSSSFEPDPIGQRGDSLSLGSISELFGPSLDASPRFGSISESSGSSDLFGLS